MHGQSKHGFRRIFGFNKTMRNGDLVAECALEGIKSKSYSSDKSRHVGVGNEIPALAGTELQ